MSKIKSTIYWIILAIIVLGYAFFFTSKFLFHEEKSLLYTELQTEQSLSNEVSLILQKWIYSPNERAMIVMFSAKNDSLQKLDLNWSTTECHTNTLLNIETGSTQRGLITFGITSSFSAITEYINSDGRTGVIAESVKDNPEQQKQMDDVVKVFKDSVK